jgi:hypothetical protein
VSGVVMEAERRTEKQAGATSMPARQATQCVSLPFQNAPAGGPGGKSVAARQEHSVVGKRYPALCRPSTL